MSGACGGPTLASDTYGKTLSTMDSLRDTLRDEHTCLLQATFIFSPPSRTPLCAPSPPPPPPLCHPAAPHWLVRSFSQHAALAARFRDNHFLYCIATALRMRCPPRLTRDCTSLTCIL